MGSPLGAMVIKEFRQMGRNRRSVAMMVGLPIMMLIVFGYAARFDVVDVPTAVLGPGSERLAGSLDEVFRTVEVDPGAGEAEARQMLADSEAAVAIVTGPEPKVLVDGTELFLAQSVLRRADAVPPGTEVEILFNPNLDTSAVMVPSLIGYIMLFVGTVGTSLGVVREREEGTMEQLAVMPLRSVDVILGKIAPYFAVAAADMVAITLAGIWIFDVPLRGSIPALAAFGLVYLFVVLGLGILISTVSQSQGEAIQMAIMVLLPQVMLSGMIFPLASMAAGVRWIGYLLPLTYFVTGMRGIFLKDASLASLAGPFGILVAMAVVIFGLAVLRFRRDLVPAGALA